MSRIPKDKYFQQRLNQAIESGNTRKAEYYRSRLSQMTTPIEDVSPKERALTNCRKAFEGLTESERLIEANEFFTKACAEGVSVNQAIAFMKEANVMSDTEMMHSLTF